MVHTDESARLENLAAFVELILEKFELDGPLGVEWSNHCSRPRLDAYGGGAFVACRGKETRWLNTNQWMSEVALDMEADRDIDTAEAKEGEE